MPSTTRIRISRLSKTFRRTGGTTVTPVDQVDLEVGADEMLVLLGPSGCGKTTLLRSLAGFHAPDSGRILFGDEDVTALAPHRRNTGMMFQSYALWPHLSVEENVAFGLEERKVPRDEIRRRVGEALESVHMGGFASRRPNELSGGQQQRLCIARAVVNRPNLLIADEPTASLDAESAVEIMQIFREFHQVGVTVLIATHDRALLDMMKPRVLSLKQGRLE